MIDDQLPQIGDDHVRRKMPAAGIIGSSSQRTPVAGKQGAFESQPVLAGRMSLRMSFPTYKTDAGERPRWENISAASSNMKPDGLATLKAIRKKDQLRVKSAHVQGCAQQLFQQKGCIKLCVGDDSQGQAPPPAGRQKILESRHGANRIDDSFILQCKGLHPGRVTCEPSTVFQTRTMSTSG